MKTTTFHPFRSEQAKQEYLELYEKKAASWPVPSQTKMVESSYGQTFVRISGPDNAPPLVLLPPAAGNSLSWLPHVKTLSTHYKTYAVDSIYDYGRSIYSRPIKNADQFADWLDEIFNALEFEKVNLIGLSYGGWLITQYALRFSHRLAKIVLVAPVGIVLPLSLEFRIRSALSAWPCKYFTKSFMLWMAGDLVKKSNVIRKIVDKSVDDLFQVKKYFKPKRLVAPSVLDDVQLQSIKVPALYLIGENEKTYSVPKTIARLNSIAPQIKTVIIPAAGHDLLISQTEIVYHNIFEFLQS